MRQVTDEEFRLAYYGDKNDPKSLAAALDNRNVIKKACHSFRNRLSEDELISCGMLATWKALKHYDPKYKQKFTTSLYRFVNWECLTELRQHHPIGEPPEGKEGVTLPSLEDRLYVIECLSKLPPCYRRILKQRFLLNVSFQELGRLNGVAKETARKRYTICINRLKELVRNQK